jgi:hypothetical protein
VPKEHGFEHQAQEVSDYPRVTKCPARRRALSIHFSIHHMPADFIISKTR